MDTGSFIKFGLLVAIVSIIQGCVKGYVIRPNIQWWNNPRYECSATDEFPYCHQGKGFLLSVKIGESDE